ncbi:MAG: carboxypeptidase regulatory-like domain-containing protein, partial [Armatimonadota bacterium]
MGRRAAISAMLLLLMCSVAAALAADTCSSTPLSMTRSDAAYLLAHSDAGFGSYTPPATASYPDVPVGSCHFAEIEFMKSTGIISGYPDGAFHFEYVVTRDDFAVFFAREIAGGDANVPAGPATATFPDVPPAYWAYKYIEYAILHGATGCVDGTFQPTINMDLYEAVDWVTAGTGVTVDPTTVACSPTGSLSGTVTDGVTHAAIAGATVTCQGLSATTAGDGTYLLDLVPVGTGLSAQASAPYYEAVLRTDISITAAATTVADFALTPTTGAISGTVRDAGTLAGIAGASVTCGPVTATTAVDGTYTLAFVPVGTAYSVIATAPSYDPNGEPGVSVAADQTTIVDITLAPQVGSIFGTVTDATTKLPIGAATVTCGAPTTTTNARGEYGFTGLRIGSYTVTASAGGHTSASASSVSVTKDTTTRVDLALTTTASGSIAGTVTDAANGAPIQNAQVTCGALSARTGADGTYTLTNVPVGQGYRIGASAGGYKWGTATGVSVVSGQTASQDFALDLLPFTTGPQFQDISDLAKLPNAVGVAWGDYDGDGYPDLFLAGEAEGASGFVAHGPMLFHNNHDLTFTDVSASFKLPSTTTTPQDGPGWADFDNDGDLDILVASGSRFPYLYQRDATQFVEIGQAAGFDLGGPSRHVAWCDYDGDNWLDVFVPINGQDSYLFHNNRDGTFTDVHAQAGIFTYAFYSAGAGVGGMSASWGDYDNDGLPDLFITRIRGAAMLYHNNGDGTFTDVSEKAGITAAFDAYSVVWGDYDNDGWLDCYVSSGQYTDPQNRRDWLFHNNHDGTFTDVAGVSGMAGDAASQMAATFGDYDNDGYIDIYVGNNTDAPFLYHNNGDASFTNVAVGSGLEGSFTNDGAAWADIDLDGRIDLVQGTSDDHTRLFHNIGPVGNWLRVRAITNAIGDATDTSKPTRDAIGARVEVDVDNSGTFPAGRTLTRLIGCNSGHSAQDEQVAQFGIPTDGPVAVRVRFPDGTVVIRYG